MNCYFFCKSLQNLLFASFVFFLSCVLFLGSAKAAGPPFPFPGSSRGQQAIEALADRLPAVASEYGKSAEKLEEVLLRNKDLWLDQENQLVYLCTFELQGDEIPAETSDAVAANGLIPYDQTFLLHSVPGASKKIYLDFDGHVTSGTIWNSNFNGDSDIVSLPYDTDGDTATFSNAELNSIQDIWKRVAEDFAMYNVDVTTEDPGLEALRRSNTSDTFYGVRVVISPSSAWYGNAGGVAYVGSFNWSTDTPTFVFSNKLGNGYPKYVAEASSHETGHTLGLYHDGKTDGTEYYRGHGDWAPIMGVGYYEPITQFSRGEYAGANNTEDDLAKMLNEGISYRDDDHGDWIDNATPLAGTSIAVSGIIEQNTDMDVFSFQTEAGDIFINAYPADPDANLDIFLQLLDNGGNVIGQDDPYYILSAGLTISLPAGTYYLLIDGGGTGDPDTGYSDYASLGQYFIFANLPDVQAPPAAPSDLSAAALSFDQIGLNWLDQSGNEDGFTVERSPNGDDTWTPIAAVGPNVTSYTDTGLSSRTTYFYRVLAYNGLGVSDYSNSAEATTPGLPPPAPAGLSAAAVSASRIDLNWTDTAVDEDGFTVERSMNSFGPWQPVASVGADSTWYYDTGLDPGTTYLYRVLAYNVDGNSAYSNTAEAATLEVVPGAPTDLFATAVSTDQIDLAWTDTADNENGFTVERSPDPTDGWLEIDYTGPNSTTYSDIGLVPATEYFYRVFAYNTAGSSGYSNQAEAATDDLPLFVDQAAVGETPVAGTLAGTYFDTATNDSIAQTITERSSGGKPQNRYSFLEHKWQFNVQPGSAVTLFVNAWATASADGDSFVFSYSLDDVNYTEMFSVTDETDSTMYLTYMLPASLSGTLFVKVTDTDRSKGSNDRDSISIDHLFIRTDTVPVDPPTAPSGLTAAPLSSSEISISWVDNGDNETGYYIERSADATSWARVGSTGPDFTGYTDSGLDGGQNYYYRVQAYNGSGVSVFSNTAAATTLQPAALHVGSLAAASSANRNRWDAFVTVTIHDNDGKPVAGANVSGSWSIGGSSMTVTDASGQTTVSNTRIKTSVASTTFTVTDVSGAGYIYAPGSNVAGSIEVFSP